MMKFTIYKYCFQKTNNLFAGKEEWSFNRVLERLSELLDEKCLNVYKVKKDGTPVIYTNQIERTKGGVTYLRFCDRILRKRVKNFEEHMEDNEPFCAVVIDHRSGYEQIAIEHKSNVFEGKTDKIRDLLQEAFNRTFREGGFEIVIKRKIQVTDFWNMVSKRVNDAKDTIKKIVLDFPDPERTLSLAGDPEAVNRLRLFSQLAKQTNAKDYQMLFSASPGTSLRLERAEEDMTHIVDVCCRYGYNISVHFRQMGVYKSKDTINAWSELEAQVLTDFQCLKIVNYGEGDTFELLEWLEKIKCETENYEDEKPREKRRKRKTFRRVS